MARLYLFAEGRTEQTFADNVLKPHLAQYEVFMHNPMLIAHAKKKGRVHRGGVAKYKPMKNDILRFLAQEKDADVFFTTMIDLYGIHPDFPGLDEAEKLRHMPQQRVELLEQHFARDIGDQRFIPYIQLHEFVYDHHANEIAALKAIADGYDTPELIDDGQHSAPSKRVITQLPDYEDAKSAVGPQVAELIGLNVIRGKCPHFSAWLSRLEQLGAGTH
jgi:hypothetical protein